MELEFLSIRDRIALGGETSWITIRPKKHRRPGRIRWPIYMESLSAPKSGIS